MGFLKFANSSLLEVEVARPGGYLMKDAHRAVFHYQPREGYLYVRSRAISSRTNDNFDTFPAEEIKQAWASFIGKPVFVNHHNDDILRKRGVIIDAVLHEDTAPDGTPDTWVEVLMEIDAVRFPKLAAAILAGDIERTSMGCDVVESECSVCGNVARTPNQYCAHVERMKGQRIRRRSASTGGTEDVLVHEICRGLSFFENSLLVEPPADPTAYFLGVDDRGVRSMGMNKAASKTAGQWDYGPTVPSRSAGTRWEGILSLPNPAAYQVSVRWPGDEVNLLSGVFDSEDRANEWVQMCRDAGAADVFVTNGGMTRAARMTASRKTSGDDRWVREDKNDEPAEFSFDWLLENGKELPPQYRTPAYLREAEDWYRAHPELRPGSKTAMTQQEADQILAPLSEPYRSQLAKFVPYAVYGPQYSRGITGNLMDARRAALNGDAKAYALYLSKCEAGYDIEIEGNENTWYYDSTMGQYTKRLAMKTAVVEWPAVEGEEKPELITWDEWEMNGSSNYGLGLAAGSAGGSLDDAVKWAGPTDLEEFQRGFNDGMQRRGSLEATEQMVCEKCGYDVDNSPYGRGHIPRTDRHPNGYPPGFDTRHRVVAVPSSTSDGRTFDAEGDDGLTDLGRTLRNRLHHHAFGETTVPPKIDTLRLAECPVCGEEADWDGTGRCRTCGYIPPPEPFRDPDLEIAKRVDMTDGWINPDLAKAPPFEEPE